MTLLPPASGLYDPRHEHDACGVGFVATLGGPASHDIVKHGLEILRNLSHRGACGCDPLTGDGAGLLLQLAHGFFVRECSALSLDLPAPGEYGVGFVFLPRNAEQRRACEQIVEDKILATGQRLIGWRDVPVHETACGPLARQTMPVMRQVLVGSTVPSGADFERKLFVIRKWAENTVRATELDERRQFYIPSLSSRTIVYKGLLLAEQLSGFYPDLDDELMVSQLAMVHQRFSTNTFPTWQLAQPFRVLGHNGEINTLRGNTAWMSAREQIFDGAFFGRDLEHIRPVIAPGNSDSASLDNVAEMLMQPAAAWRM